MEPGDRLDAAREMLAVLAEGIPGDDPYQRFSAAYAERLGKRSDAVLYHDDLEPLNRPILFTDFLAEAAPHGLKYVAEADWFEMTSTRLPPAAAELLERSGQDRIAREQYLDFLKCRAYRQTLLCRDEVRMDAAPSAENVRALMAAAPVRPSSKRVDACGSLEGRVPDGEGGDDDHGSPAAEGRPPRARARRGRGGSPSLRWSPRPRSGGRRSGRGERTRPGRPVAARLRREPDPAPHIRAAARGRARRAAALQRAGTQAACPRRRDGHEPRPRNGRPRRADAAARRAGRWHP